MKPARPRGPPALGSGGLVKLADVLVAPSGDLHEVLGARRTKRRQLALGFGGWTTCVFPVSELGRRADFRGPDANPRPSPGFGARTSTSCRVGLPPPRKHPKADGPVVAGGENRLVFGGVPLGVTSAPVGRSGFVSSLGQSPGAMSRFRSSL